MDKLGYKEFAQICLKNELGSRLTTQLWHEYIRAETADQYEGIIYKLLRLARR